MISGLLFFLLFFKIEDHNVFDCRKFNQGIPKFLYSIFLKFCPKKILTKKAAADLS